MSTKQDFTLPDLYQDQNDCMHDSFSRPTRPYSPCHQSEQSSNPATISDNEITDLDETPIGQNTVESVEHLQTHQDTIYNISWPPRSSTASNDISWIHDNPPSSPMSTSPIEPPPPPNRSIYALQTRPGYGVTVLPYQPTWPAQYDTIKSHLHNLFTTSSPPAPYKAIEHIGSTSIPDLAAKPNIDVLVTFATRSDLEAAFEALEWEMPSAPPFVRYTRVPDGGGIQGRESFKLYVPHFSEYYYSTPERSVYLIEDSEENLAGRVQVRCYRSIRETLRDERNVDLLREYGELKIELGKRVYADSITYSRLKDDMIRKVLRRAGWTEGEIDEKERLSERVWVSDEPAY